MWTLHTKPYKNSVRRNGTIRGAFTLIELLVVIAIISLLVSILVPSITRAKGLAKSIVCSANARGIGTALYIYADEYNERYPLATITGNWGEYIDDVDINVYSWMEQLFPYVEVKTLYQCPAKPNDSEYSYFLGSRAAFLDTGGCYDSVRRSRIKYPSALVLSGCTSHPFDVTDCDKDDYTQDCTGCPVHEDEQNILFADNHVQSYKEYVDGEMTYRYKKMGPWWMEGDPD